jgi:hypothetical protein
MSEYVVNEVKVLKKRGRKPKVKHIDTQPPKNDYINSETEVIITYLPINLNDTTINNYDESDIFIKTEMQLNNKEKDKINKEQINKEKHDILSSACDSDINTAHGIYINKINVYNIEINTDTKCWWCKNSFNCPNVTLPEQYFDDTFYCIGNFCSYNCAKAYNIDLNDNNVWKRESLLNLMYYKTYNVNKHIEPSPTWIILKEFGGFMTINEYRKNFETNNSEYILLYPPMISRQMQIEESYNKMDINTKTLNKLDKLFYPETSYTLRRTKPIETSQLNLEKTMGLKRRT